MIIDPYNEDEPAIIHDIAANWTAGNRILQAGQFGVETDTGKFKIGDGVTGWNALVYSTYTIAQITALLSGKQNSLGYTAENAANKDATGGYAGLTLFKINFKNALNTFTSFFTNANAAARTYTFQDRDGTIADLADVALKSKSTRIMGFVTFNPADATTCYFGQFFTNTVPATTPGNPEKTMTAQVAGTINKINVGWWMNTSYGTSENSTLKIKNLTTGIEVTLSSTLTFASVIATSPRSINYTGVGLAVSAGDSLEMQLVTPTWVTNPVGLNMNCTIIIE
jgi:hypothetical protein